MLRRLTQRAGFAVLEARPVRPVPQATDAWTSLTCLARLPDELARDLASTVLLWPGAADHHAYPANRLHVTLLNIDDVDDDPDALDRVAEVLTRARRVSLVLNGIGVTSHSVFVRAYDADGSLDDVRRSLIDVTGSAPDWPRRRLAFVNVLRFRSTAAASLVAAARTARFGPAELVLDRAEIVRTDRLFRPEVTTLVREVPFRTSS